MRTMPLHISATLLDRVDRVLAIRRAADPAADGRLFDYLQEVFTKAVTAETDAELAAHDAALKAAADLTGETASHVA